MKSAISKYLTDDPARAHCSGPQLNELASIVAGVKSVVWTNIMDEGENKKNIERLCSDLKLRTVVLERAGKSSAAKRIDFLIGTDIKKMQAMARRYHNVLAVEWGVGLGYPECCVNAFLEWWDARRGSAGRAKGCGDLVPYIHRRSPKDRLIPFWMNNVWNFSSRLDMRDDKGAKVAPDDPGNSAAFMKRNQDLDREGFLPWHPCSYSCAETLKKGRMIYDTMAEYMPNTAKARRTTLSNPVISWDKFLFAVLDGRCRKDGNGFVVDYSGIGRPRSLLSAATEEALASHTSIRVSGSGRITRSRSMSIPAGYAFLPFSR